MKPSGLRIQGAFEVQPENLILESAEALKGVCGELLWIGFRVFRVLTCFVYHGGT